MAFREIALYLMTAIYIGAGVLHFLKPKIFRRIMPAYLPWHGALVKISGIAGIVLGMALLFPFTRDVGRVGCNSSFGSRVPGQCRAGTYFKGSYEVTTLDGNSPPTFAARSYLLGVDLYLEPG